MLPIVIILVAGILLLLMTFGVAQGLGTACSSAWDDACSDSISNSCNNSATISIGDTVRNQLNNFKWLFYTLFKF